MPIRFYMISIYLASLNRDKDSALKAIQFVVLHLGPFLKAFEFQVEAIVNIKWFIYSAIGNAMGNSLHTGTNQLFMQRWVFTRV